MKRSLAAVLVALLLVGCSSQPAPQSEAAVVDSDMQPRVLWFKATTSDGVYEAPGSRQNGQPPGGVVKEPAVKLEAAAQNAQAVWFAVGSSVGKEGPIERIGPLKPDALGRVEADWKLSRPGFTYIIWAEALRQPPTPPSQGDLVDAHGNLVGVSGALRLELDQGN